MQQENIRKNKLLTKHEANLEDFSKDEYLETSRGLVAYNKKWSVCIFMSCSGIKKSSTIKTIGAALIDN